MGGTLVVGVGVQTTRVSDVTAVMQTAHVSDVIAVFKACTNSSHTFLTPCLRIRRHTIRLQGQRLSPYDISRLLVHPWCATTIHPLPLIRPPCQAAHNLGFLINHPICYRHMLHPFFKYRHLLHPRSFLACFGLHFLPHAATFFMRA